MNYKPLGTCVLLKVLPIETGPLHIPEHLQNAAGMKKNQYFQIEAVGPGVVDEQFPVAKGDKVQIKAHPSVLVGVDHEKQLCVCDRKDLAVVCTEDDPLGNN